MTSGKKESIMKTSLVIELVLGCLLFWGCNEAVQKDPAGESLINAGLINTMNDMALENAIIAQRTLYPYHFVENSEQLNELGQRDLSVLAEHLKKNPGPLNVCNDGIPESLYQARLAYVADKLKQTGIDPNQITVSDGMPGGRGMTCSEVLQIKEANQKARNERRERYPEVNSRSSNQ